MKLFQLVNEDDYELRLDDGQVINIIYDGFSYPLKGVCFIDYGTSKYGDNYCSLYTDFETTHNDPPITCLADFQIHPILSRVFDIDRTNKSHDQIIAGLN